MKKKFNHKGFTLVELAIVLVIVGLLIGMGATLIGPLTKRAKYNESQNVVKEVYSAVTGYALANKKLPVDLTSVGVRTKDGYAQNLLYYAAGNITASNFCTVQGTYLTVDDNGTTRTNVAFVVFSQGENRCNQTGTTSPFTIVDAGVAAGTCADPNAGYDDIVMYQDINTLRQQVCNSFRIVTEGLPAGTEEFAYPSTTLNATDGTPAYTWSVVGQAQGTNGCAGTDFPVTSVNTGLCLTTGGVISGTPIADGSYNFTVQVCDNDDPNLPNDCPPTTNKDRVATRSFSITINPNDPRITTEFLTYGTVNQAYPSTTLSATGGRTPYTWSSGSPPAGLSLNAGTGVISGTPTVEGTYPFAVTVADSGSRTASKTLSIAINPAGSGGGSGGGGGLSDYRVWNNTGSRRDFIVDGTCRRINNGAEITTAALRLNSGETIDRYATNNGSCGGGVQEQLSYTSAVYADSDGDGLVNFTGTDR